LKKKLRFALGKKTLQLLKNFDQVSTKKLFHENSLKIIEKKNWDFEVVKIVSQPS
jgi:hypothetical protein